MYEFHAKLKYQLKISAQAAFTLEQDKTTISSQDNFWKETRILQLYTVLQTQ